jgi:hypothetical protein
MFFFLYSFIDLSIFVLIDINAWIKERKFLIHMNTKNWDLCFIDSLMSFVRDLRQARKRRRCCRNRSIVWALASTTTTSITSSFSMGFHYWWFQRNKLLIRLSLTSSFFLLVVCSMIINFRISWQHLLIYTIQFYSKRISWYRVHFSFDDLSVCDYSRTQREKKFIVPVMCTIISQSYWISHRIY